MNRVRPVAVAKPKNPRERKPRGRYAKTRQWFSPEFVAWCQRHHVKPEGIARCILHTFALERLGTRELLITSNAPVPDDEIFEP